MLFDELIAPGDEPVEKNTSKKLEKRHTTRHRTVVFLLPFLLNVLPRSPAPAKLGAPRPAPPRMQRRERGEEARNEGLRREQAVRVVRGHRVATVSFNPRAQLMHDVRTGLRKVDAPVCARVCV